ncbi:MAG: hypothetical protein KDB94_11390 [Acidobacteria bacterium]|nr:hypothetical protein [Acidobacteriota bacterium]
MRRASALVVAGAFAGASTAVAALPTNAPATACLTDGQVEDVLLLDGVAYLAGRFSHVRPPGAAIGDPEEVERIFFAACDAATGTVLAWNPQATCDAATYPVCANNPRGQTIALSADGQSLYIGGKFREVAGQPRRHAAKVSRATAALDPDWQPEPADRVQRLALAPGGARVYVAGNFTSLGGCSPAPCHAHLAAVDPATGAIDAGFDPRVECDDQGGSCFTSVYSLLPDPEGAKLYLGGQFGAVNGVVRDSVAAVDAATGAATLDFAPQLADTNPNDPYVQVHDLAFDGDWLYVCGDWWATGGVGDMQNQRNVNRFDPETGAVDNDFWIATDGGVQACVVDANLGLLFVGGHFDCVREWLDSTTPVDPSPSQCGTDPLFVGTVQRDLFALTLAGGELTAWNPDTGGTPGIWAAAVGEGRLFVGGEVRWPRQATTATHQNLLAFDVALFADGFERGTVERWSVSLPAP